MILLALWTLLALAGVGALAYWFGFRAGRFAALDDIERLAKARGAWRHVG